jgi:hypothetical protein
MALAPMIQLLGADNVDTRDYHGRAGDAIRIDPFAVAKVAKVMVSIRCDSHHLIERGLAKLNPRTNV